MLVRLEVHGFKNLLGFSAEFGPFTCIAGAGGIGKSNIFDAIRFLALLADHPLEDAACRVRGPEDGRPAPEELFFTDGKHRADVMHFAAEMLVPDAIEDDFGRPASPTATLLRYELDLGLAPPARPGDPGRLVLIGEALHHINKGDAHRHLRFRHSASRFREAAVRNARSGGAFIATEPGPGGEPAVRVHGDGGHPGLLHPSPTDRAPSTVVSVTTTADRPTILAARREMQSWRRLALVPSALRQDDAFSAPRRLAEDGAHLAASLFGLAARDPRGPEPAYADLAARVAPLAAIEAVRVDRDDHRRLLRLEARVEDGPWLPARALSDGTLRALALAVAVADAEPGLLCIEEPENGLHPSRLIALAALLQGRVVNPRHAPGADNPLRQVIVTTHSPALVALQSPESVLVAESVMAESVSPRPGATVRLVAPAGTWRSTARAEDADALASEDPASPPRTPAGENLQLRLDLEEAPE